MRSGQNVYGGLVTSRIWEGREGVADFQSDFGGFDHGIKIVKKITGPSLTPFNDFFHSLNPCLRSSLNTSSYRVRYFSIATDGIKGKSRP